MSARERIDAVAGTVMGGIAVAVAWLYITIKERIR